MASSPDSLSNIRLIQRVGAVHDYACDLEPRHHNGLGAAHGGFLMLIIEQVARDAARHALAARQAGEAAPAGEVVAGQSQSIWFHRPTQGSRLQLKAVVEELGRSGCMVRVTVKPYGAAAATVSANGVWRVAA